jgi:hypothetical protein
MHFADHFEENNDHCLMLDTFKCLIYCTQCEIEITDIKSDNFSSESKSNIFNFRKMFFPKLEIDRRIQKFPNFLNKKCNFPFRFLEQSIALVFSNNYLRATFKKVYIANAYVSLHFKKQIYSEVISLTSELITNFNKNIEMSEIFEKLYFCLIAKEKSLASYADNNFGVNLIRNFTNYL